MQACELGASGLTQKLCLYVCMYICKYVQNRFVIEI